MLNISSCSKLEDTDMIFWNSSLRTLIMSNMGDDLTFNIYTNYLPLIRYWDLSGCMGIESLPSGITVMESLEVLVSCTVFLP